MAVVVEVAVEVQTSCNRANSLIPPWLYARQALCAAEDAVEVAGAGRDLASGAGEIGGLLGQDDDPSRTGRERSSDVCCASRGREDVRDLFPVEVCDVYRGTPELGRIARAEATRRRDDLRP